MKTTIRLLSICCLAFLLTLALSAVFLAKAEQKVRRKPLRKPVPRYQTPPLEEPPEPSGNEEQALSRTSAEIGSGRWEGGLKAALMLPSLGDDLGWRNEGHGTLFWAGTEPISTSAGFLTELYGGYRWFESFSTGLFMSVHGYHSDVSHENDYTLALAFGLRLKYHLAIADDVEIRPVASVSWGLNVLGGEGAAPELPVEVENRADGSLILQGAIEVVYMFSERLGVLFDVGVLAIPYSFQNVKIESRDEALDLFRVEGKFGPALYVSAGIELKLD